MSTAQIEQKEEAFRIGMLLSDTRYRSYTIQVIALILFFGSIYYLAQNIISNLEALGKDFSFRFLWDPASYDINQRLIEYTSRSPHWKAALVGILNTLLVAFLGCIAATIIGVFAGILRLSKNWVVSKLMTVYIEGVRNIPVLLQILFWYAIIIESLPSPKQASPVLGGSLVATNRGFYLPKPIWDSGSGVVVAVFLLSIIAIFLFGRWATQRQLATGERLPTFWIKLAIFVVPSVLFYFIMGSPISLSYPVLKGFNFQGGIQARASLFALWFALSLYTGAFIAENVRAGIQTISKGQSEASHALGIRPGITMQLVILPQALRVIIPPLISQYLNLTKNSSLAIAVGYMDATGTLGGITLNQTGREWETLMLLMAFYLSVSLTISMVMNWYNNKVRLVER
jgi:general L-amino acid transport system permease protein